LHGVLTKFYNFPHVHTAHHFASQLGNADNSMNSLMLKTGLSRDQLSQLARDRGLTSSGSLNNLMNRQKSFDALMSLDFQSLQSIDNLANLIQTGGVSGGGLNMPVSGMKNADFGAMLSAASSRNNLNTSSPPGSLEQDFSDAAQRLANANSANRMDALLRNLSNSNVPSSSSGGGDTSNAALSNLLQSMQANLHQLNGQGGNASTSSLFNQNGMDGNGNSASQSALNLARFLRPESSTGLSALRMQDGLSQRNSSSVDDFLSLVAAGDIPHQDPSLLNVPLMQQQDAAAKLLAQQQLLQASGSTSAFGNSLTSGQSFNNMRNGTNNNMDSTSASSSSHFSDSTSALALAMAQVRAAAMQNGNGKRPSDLMSGMIADKDNTKR
jgi:hypothetical protein